jgi:hypothetical protein
MLQSSFLQCISVSVLYNAQFIGDWHENSQGAPNTIILLIIRQFYWRTNATCAKSNDEQDTQKIRET